MPTPLSPPHPVRHLPAPPFGRRLLRAGHALLWLGGALFAAAGDEVPAPPAASIRTRTDWVVVPVNLRPAEGTALPATFAPDDFRLFVDGKEVRRFSFLPEKNAPLLVGVVVDRQSGQVRRHVAWLRRFLEGLFYACGREDAFFVASCGGDYFVVQPATSDRARLQELVFGLCPENVLETAETREQDGRVAGGLFGEKVCNKIAIAVDKALAELRQGGARRKVLVVVTDGDENLSPITLRNIQNTGYPIFFVCFKGSGFGRDTLFRRGRQARRLSVESGGICTAFDGGTDPVGQARLLAGAAHSQVVLAFDPDPALDKEKAHEIRVECRLPGVLPLHRRSFLMEK